MKNHGIDPQIRQLFENYVQALSTGSADEIVKARTAWFEKYPSDAEKRMTSGIKVIDKSDIASRSGQLSLAAVLATEGGLRPTTRAEIREALRFWAGTTELIDSKEYGHFDWMSKEPRLWGQIDKNKHPWTLEMEDAGRISEEAFRIVEAYRQKSADSIERRDIEDIYSQQHISETVRIALVNARLGQGQFRQDLLKLWDNQCAVTGTTVTQVIRASHIKPWRDSSNEERLDPHNGLPLVATLDALFDAGLITFDASGAMRVSNRLSNAERERLCLTGLRLRSMPSEETMHYLLQHKFVP